MYASNSLFATSCGGNNERKSWTLLSLTYSGGGVGVGITPVLFHAGSIAASYPRPSTKSCIDEANAAPEVGPKNKCCRASSFKYGLSARPFGTDGSDDRLSRVSLLEDADCIALAESDPEDISNADSFGNT